MLNQLCLVGRVEEILDLHKIVIKVPRSFKNELGEYENDYIDLTLPDTVDMSMLNIGDIVGVKARLKQQFPSDLEIVVEKVTFLSSK